MGRNFTTCLIGKLGKGLEKRYDLIKEQKIGSDVGGT
jgi:hypothetical protein